jgi:two-component system phosphate regulon sensor histidine kinase PhoR
MQIKLNTFRFPWKIYSGVIVLQAITVLLSFLVAGLTARHFFTSHFLNHFEYCGPRCVSEFHVLLRKFDTALIISLITLSVILSLFGWFFAKKLILPIGRLLTKAKSVLNPQTLLSPESDRLQLEAIDQEPDPAWSDLEISIEEIRRDLEKKIESLRNEREEQATLMGAISDAILAVDLDGAPLFYNSRTELLFGDKALSGQLRLWEIVRNPEILGAFRATLKQSKSMEIKAIPFDLPTGKRFFSAAVAPLRDAREKIYGAVGIFHDVTDLKLAEQIRIDFVANVSHELRTPLTAIKGYADTLKLDIQAGKPASLDFIEVINRNADRLMNLIQDLLDLSSIESTDSLIKSEIPIRDLSDRVIKQMAGAFERKNQTVEIHPLATTVYADSRRVEQILVNLLDNANKYSPAGGKIILTWETQIHGEVLLKVKDTGPGIAIEHHSRLFERFYRVDKARSREQGGTGLGLAIVKHIMQGHKGSAWVESTPGNGTTFICRFPDFSK